MGFLVATQKEPVKLLVKMKSFENRNWDDEVCKDRELLPCLDERYMNECDVH